MPPAGFESAIPASKGLQTHAFDRTATGIGDPLLRQMYQVHILPSVSELLCLLPCHLFLHLQNGFFLSGFPTKTMPCLVYLIHASCSVHLILTVQFLQPHITFSLININILLAPCSETSLVHFFPLIFRHRVSCILGQAFHYSPENAFYIFNQQIYFII